MIDINDLMQLGYIYIFLYDKRLGTYQITIQIENSILVRNIKYKTYTIVRNLNRVSNILIIFNF